MRGTYQFKRSWPTYILFKGSENINCQYVFVSNVLKGMYNDGHVTPFCPHAVQDAATQFCYVSTRGAYR